MITGSLVALVTPMQVNGDIDWPALKSLVEWHIAEGTHGIVAVGTTGESATLDVNEHCAVIKSVVETVNKRIPVIARTGANSTREAIELTRSAQAAGADACFWLRHIIISPLKKVYISIIKPLLNPLIFHKFYTMYQVVQV